MFWGSVVVDLVQPGEQEPQFYHKGILDLTQTAAEANMAKGDYIGDSNGIPEIITYYDTKNWSCSILYSLFTDWVGMGLLKKTIGIYSQNINLIKIMSTYILFC